jgi:hypothetical protein
MFKVPELKAKVKILLKIVVRSIYPNEVLIWIDDYAKSNLCFYIEELQSALKVKFPTVTINSVQTFCRALKFDLKLSKKVLTKRAREATIEMKDSYYTLK